MSLREQFGEGNVKFIFHLILLFYTFCIILILLCACIISKITKQLSKKGNEGDRDQQEPLRFEFDFLF